MLGNEFAWAATRDGSSKERECGNVSVAIPRFGMPRTHGAREVTGKACW